MLSDLSSMDYTELNFLISHYSKNLPLINKKVLITAGPTLEPIDPVRFISNHSSGKMGYRLAEEAKRLGASVCLISGPSNETLIETGIDLVMSVLLIRWKRK